MSEHIRQELIPEEVRNSILEKIMMLKSWFEDNMDRELESFEYHYVSEALLKQTQLPYSNRDLFDIWLWAQKVPTLPGKWARQKTEFDKNIIPFMDSVGLDWKVWGNYLKLNT